MVGTLSNSVILHLTEQKTDSIPDLNPGGPREGGCVEGLRDHASLGGIGTVGVPGRVGEDRRWGREESLDFVHVKELFHPILSKAITAKGDNITC